MNLDEAIEFHRARRRASPPPPPGPEKAEAIKALLGLVPREPSGQQVGHDVG